MSDIKLFRIEEHEAVEIEGTSVAVEKTLQTMIERHLEAFFGVRFLASEFITGKTHGGRIDTLGIDENNYPVIIEYKRALNENVINQGLFYLDWLMGHKKDFEWLVLKQFGEQAANDIEWSAPRLLCIAGDFTRYDEHAVQQIARDSELVRYRRYGEDLVLFELAAASGGASNWVATVSKGEQTLKDGESKPSGQVPAVLQTLAKCPPAVHNRYEALRAHLLALGDDVQENTLDSYIAFRRIKNFATVHFRSQKGWVLLNLNVNPDSIDLVPGFTSDKRPTGTSGVWQLQVTIDSDDDLERVQPLVMKSYQVS